MKKRRTRKRTVGGLKRKKKWTHNIVPASRLMGGAGPARSSGGPGFARSLRTHQIIRPGRTGTFAVG